MDALFTSIIRLYEQEISMKEIARRLGISEQKVRKILITCGLYETDSTRMAMELKNSGLAISEIAEQMRITKQAVNALLPYEKCMYNAEYPTINAMRIRQGRTKTQK